MFKQKKPAWLLYVCSIIFSGVITSGTASASAIPETYDIVILPANTLQQRFTSFTDMNNRNLAVIYGTQDNVTTTFVFNYRTREIIASIENLWPFAINDNNQIIGVDVSQASLPVKTCTLIGTACTLRGIDGAENTLPFYPNTLTNSNVFIGRFYPGGIGAAPEFRVYLRGILFDTSLESADGEGFTEMMRSVQQNNTRLIVGSKKNTSNLHRPIIKIIGNGVTTQDLPLPPGITDSESVLAVNVNSRDEIILSAHRDTGTVELYVCQYIGDVDGDGTGDCATDMRLLGESNIVPIALGSRVPINDRGLVVAPPVKNGEITLYDLNDPDSAGIPVSTLGNTGVDVFAFSTPQKVNNQGVILVQGAQTVLFVPPPATTDLRVDLDINETINMPAQGSRLLFAETVTNQSADNKRFLSWQTVIMPDGTPFPRSNAKRISLAASDSYTNHLRLRLPGYFPPGEYRYIAFVVDESNGEITKDEFRIIKLP